MPSIAPVLEEGLAVFAKEYQYTEADLVGERAKVYAAIKWVSEFDAAPEGTVVPH